MLFVQLARMAMRTTATAAVFKIKKWDSRVPDCRQAGAGMTVAKKKSDK